MKLSLNIATGTILWEGHAVALLVPSCPAMFKAGFIEFLSRAQDGMVPVPGTPTIPRPPLSS